MSNDSTVPQSQFKLGNVVLSAMRSSEDYWKKNNFSMPVEHIRALVDLPLYEWQPNEYHPLLLCACKKSMKCKAIRNNGTMWVCNKEKNHIMWSDDASQVMFKLRYMLDRKPSLQGFFSPSQTRLQTTVGFNLVNHVPPMANEKHWKQSKPLKLLSSSLQTVPQTQSLHCTNLAGSVSYETISAWSSMPEPKPQPTIFRSFPATPYEERCVRSYVAKLLSSSPSLRLVNEDCIVLPSVSPENQPCDNDKIIRTMSTMDDNSLLVVGSTAMDSTVSFFDYIFYVGDTTRMVKVLAPWEVACSGKFFFIPLHGMGVDDNDWIFGSSDTILLEIDSELIVAKTSAIRKWAVNNYGSFMALPSGGGGASGRDEDATLVRKPVPMSSVIEHMSSSNGIAKPLAPCTNTFVAPALDEREIMIREAMRSCIDYQVSLDEVSYVCDSSSPSSLDNMKSDCERHDARTSFCGPDCCPSEADMQRNKRRVSNIASDETIFIGADINSSEQDMESIRYNGETQEIQVVSLSDGGAFDAYLMISPSRLLGLMRENAMIRE